MAKRVKKTTAVKKKSWIKVHAPASFGRAELGETYVNEAEEVVGKSFKVNAMTLLNDPKKRRYNIAFTVTGLNNGLPITKPISYEIQPASMKTMIRKKRDRVDHRIKVVLADDSNVVIKPIIITRTNTAKDVHTALRKEAENMLTKKASEMSLDDFFAAIVSGRLTKDLKAPLSKIYPVNVVDIRVLEVESFGEKAVVKKRAPKKDVEVKAEEQEESDASASEDEESSN